jgi:hypothetical protein
MAEVWLIGVSGDSGRHHTSYSLASKPPGDTLFRACSYDTDAIPNTGIPKETPPSSRALRIQAALNQLIPSNIHQHIYCASRLLIPATPSILLRPIIAISGLRAPRTSPPPHFKDLADLPVTKRAQKQRIVDIYRSRNVDFRLRPQALGIARRSHLAAPKEY